MKSIKLQYPESLIPDIRPEAKVSEVERPSLTISAIRDQLPHFKSIYDVACSFNSSLPTMLFLGTMTDHGYCRSAHYLSWPPSGLL